MRNMIAAIFVVAASTILMSCDGMSSAQREVVLRVQNREVDVPKNDVEYKNYMKRSLLADDPTVILWCTTAFPIPGSPIFTVPIVGKLTSGNKRPFPTEYSTSGGVSELPGPDGMYGSSGEYRYGFTPADVYADYYNMSTFCTSEPMIWQRESTEIVMQRDSRLLDAHNQAREALRQNNPARADSILASTVNSIGGR